MRRIALALLIALLVAPGLWWRSPPPERSYVFDLAFRQIARPQPVAELSPLRFEGAWEMRSDHVYFGGWSALLALPDGRLAAFSDSGRSLLFSPPGDRPRGVTVFAEMLSEETIRKRDRDVEAATIDPATNTIWTAQEFANSIARHRLESGELALEAVRAPAELRNWGDNSGPESLLRLADASFLSLREGFGYFSDAERRPAMRWAGDPVDPKTKSIKFTVRGPSRFSPVDMAALPDGRVLVLYRRVIWPFPQRFRARLAIGDPGEIREGREWRLQEIAGLPPSLPLDNFEGLAVREVSGDEVELWLVSDDNQAGLQRSLLWKLTVDPARLPGAPKQPAKRSVSASD